MAFLHVDWLTVTVLLAPVLRFALRAQRKDGSSSDAHQNQLLVSTTGMAVLFGTAFGYGHGYGMRRECGV